MKVSQPKGLYRIRTNTVKGANTMKIKITIELEDYNDKFRVTSSDHISISEAFAEVASVAENQKRLIQGRNYARNR